MSLINCEINLILTWSENCVLTEMITHVGIPNADTAVAAINAPTNVKYKIIDTILYVPVVTLSTKGDNKLLEQLKTVFKRTIKSDKYRSEMTNQAKTNNSNYLLVPIFIKVNRLFVLSFENEDDRATVEIKDHNVVIDCKSFFDVPIKNKEETYETIVEMNKNNDYTTGNLLDYVYFSKHFKLIAIDLSKQIELEDADTMQQINFIGRLEKYEGVTMFSNF